MVAVVLLLFFLFFLADVVVEVGGKFGKSILGTDTMLVSVEAGVAFFFFLGGPLQFRRSTTTHFSQIKRNAIDVELPVSKHSCNIC